MDFRSRMQRAGLWLMQIRGPFLILAVALVAIGWAAAAREVPIPGIRLALLFFGVVAAHASVNLFNELSDYQTGIDAATRRTPFSGGSGLMVNGLMKPRSVRIAAYGMLVFAALIGFHFVLLRGVWILVFMVLGGVSIRFYTTHFARWRIGEAMAGLTLGSFVVLGTYFALTGRFTPEIVWISIPPGLLTSLLLFLNEFPDQEADRKGGRRHWVVRFGRRACAAGYAWALALVYAWIIVGPFVVRLPRTIWLGLITLPLGICAAHRVLSHPEDHDLLLPALGMNVAVVIVTDLLLVLGLAF
jgi:1,4-dihydroxy-2-naphthoate polyprenyltransferase